MTYSRAVVAVNETKAGAIAGGQTSMKKGTQTMKTDHLRLQFKQAHRSIMDTWLPAHSSLTHSKSMAFSPRKNRLNYQY